MSRNFLGGSRRNLIIVIHNDNYCEIVKLENIFPKTACLYIDTQATQALATLLIIFHHSANLFSFLLMKNI